MTQLRLRLPVYLLWGHFVSDCWVSETAAGVDVMPLRLTVFYCAAACTVPVVCLLHLVFAGLEQLHLPKLDTHLLFAMCCCRANCIGRYTLSAFQCTVPYHTIPCHAMPYHTIP